MEQEQGQVMLEDQAIITLYWERDERAIRESDRKYGGLCRQVAGNILPIREDVEEWAKRYSPSFSSNFSPWKNEFDKMAQKTVLRRLIGTYGIMSPDMQTAMVQDYKGKTPVQEIKENANKTPIDVNFAAVDTETGKFWKWMNLRQKMSRQLRHHSDGTSKMPGFRQHRKLLCP